jgi:hypothetical protein
MDENAVVKRLSYDRPDGHPEIKHCANRGKLVLVATT